jgi:hypothetical protein
VSLVVDHPAERPDFRVGAGPPALVEAEYHFLLGRYIDTATLARASALAAKWGVHPHDVLALALLAARRRRLFRLSWHVLLMPLYWLLISAAAYRALWQFATAPFKWEKTEHGRISGFPQQLALGRGNGAGSGNRTRDT